MLKIIMQVMSIIDAVAGVARGQGALTLLEHLVPPSYYHTVCFIWRVHFTVYVLLV